MELTNFSSNSSICYDGLHLIDWVKFCMWLYGLCTTVMVLVIFIYYQNNKFKTTFFAAATAISFADLTTQIINVIELFYHSKCYPQYPVCPRLFAFVGTVCWYNICGYQLVIAIDRFIATCFPHQYNLFTRKKALASMGFVFAFAIIINSPMLTVKYGYHYYAGFISFNFSDPDVAQYSQIRDFGIQPAILVTVICLYLSSSIAIYRHRQKTQTAASIHSLNVETRLMIQGILVTMPMVMVIILWHVFAYGQTSINVKVLSIVADINAILIVVVFIINPTVYIIFSKDLKDQLVKVLPKCRSETVSPHQYQDNHMDLDWFGH